MKTARIMTLAVLIVGSGLVLQVVRAQQPGIKRTDLQQHDLSVHGREAVQVRVDFDPGAAFGKHRHPGEEIIYVIEGSLEYEVEGKPPMTLKAGEVLFIPGRNDPRGEERRQRQRGGDCHIRRRKREAARRAGQVTAQ